MCLSRVMMCAVIVSCVDLRGTGDLGVVIEREKGSILIGENTTDSVLAEVKGLGDLSHASVVYSRDGRFVFVFGRDGGLTRVDLLKQKITHRVMQAGNSIGGAISQDGKIVAVSNYKPGGVKLFDSSNLKFIKEIPAITKSGKRSKVVGLVDAPGNKFVFSLFDAGEIWEFDIGTMKVKKHLNVGDRPYDALITPEGRYYIAGLFGENGIAVLDLWHSDKGIHKVIINYGRGNKKLPVYKMTHLEGWARAGNYLFLPAVGHHELLVVTINNWRVIKKIAVKSQVVFAMSSPDTKQIWVNFAFPDNQYLQLISVPELKIIKTYVLGKGILHMEFSPRGEKIWVSVRDENKIVVIDTKTLKIIKEIKAHRPSGIFFSSRAHKIGL